VIDAARALAPTLTFVAGCLAEMEHAPGEPGPPDAGSLAGWEWRLVPVPDEAGGAAAAERLRTFVTGLGAEVHVVTAAAGLGSALSR